MKRPALVVMAAGMGSRYGGLKQIDPVGEHGEIIMDYSVFDAKKAGFEKVVFIINKKIEDVFRSTVGERIEKQMQVSYVFQQLESCLPDGFIIPEGRVKPWGTAHAILCCKDVIDEPFAVINSDDYYGQKGFQLIFDRLSRAEDRNGVLDFSMVGFRLDNTLTDNGYVSRGVCDVDDDGKLSDIVERVHIERLPEGPAYLADDGSTYIPLSPDKLVSMNLWGFTPGILQAIEQNFPAFLEENVSRNPLKAEMYIPMEVDRLLKAGKATVDVIPSPDKWYGVTYQEDKPDVVQAMHRMTEDGLYPEKLW